MKKKYIKPNIIFESFTLNTNIAGDCEIKTWTPNSGTCAYEFKDEFGDVSYLFIEGVAACTTKQETGEFNSICYHVPISENLFNS